VIGVSERQTSHGMESDSSSGIIKDWQQRASFLAFSLTILLIRLMICVIKSPTELDELNFDVLG
jgi:hypothetical protein